MRRRWTCSFAYDCQHRWRWSAVVSQRWRAFRRRLAWRFKDRVKDSLIERL